MSLPKITPNNCPIIEQTADGCWVGRCCFFCQEDICPRHGDVKDELKRYRATGQLTFERERFLNDQIHGRIGHSGKSTNPGGEILKISDPLDEDGKSNPMWSLTLSHSSWKNLFSVIKMCVPIELEPEEQEKYLEITGKEWTIGDFWNSVRELQDQLGDEKA